MLLTINPKFEVGNKVEHCFNSNGEESTDKLYWRIQEIHTITCSAGTQIVYKCRGLYITKNKFSGERNQKHLSDKTIEFNETELREAQI